MSKIEVLLLIIIATSIVLSQKENENLLDLSWKKV